VDADVAALTAVVEQAERTIGQLRQAIVSRETVDQAKGVVMAAYRLDDAAAWALLSRISQDHNVKVVDLARAVVEVASGRQTVSDGRAAAIATAQILSPVRGRPLLDGQLDAHVRCAGSAHEG
jgi:hypothetical protein